MRKWIPNEYENALINVIQEAERYCQGELEVSKENDGWYARDYKENFGGSFVIDKNGYDTKPLISNETVKKHKVNVIKCCKLCGVYYVG